MRETTRQEIIKAMTPILNIQQLQYLNNILHNSSLNIEIQTELAKTDSIKNEDNEVLVKLFIAAKKVEGCSEKSLVYYLN
ncbi:MAG: integrase, partial [Pedobacter sp.]